MAAIAKYLDFADSIDRKLAEGDTRHDFGKSSEDIAIQVPVRAGAGGAEVKKLDCLKHFGNNIQRIVLFGDNPEDKNLSKRLTSSCKGHTVMGGSPEDSFVKYIEEKAGIPHTPSKFDQATIDAWNAANPQDEPSRGWDGSNNTPTPAGRYGQGFKKILVRGADVALIEWPRDAELVAIAAGRPLPRQGRDFVRPSVDTYREYHKRIAQALDWTDAKGPIPVIVDTTKSLHRASAPYFIVCRTKETVADPGPSSTMQYELLAEEDGTAERTHTINNVDHTFRGGLVDTTVTYHFNNPVPAAPPTQNDFVYDYSGAGISPNSIETCIGKIKNIIDGIITGAGNDPDRYQVPSGSTVAQLVKLFDAQCGIYNNLQYTISNTDMRKIALPFVAKRGGDQNQVKSCQAIINYIIKRQEYQPPAEPGGRAPGEFIYRRLGGAPISVTNCVFWTYDRLAAMFAVLNGITTILQTPAKDIIIYKNIAYEDARAIRGPIALAAPEVAPAAAARGGACTRAAIQQIRQGDAAVIAANPDADLFSTDRRITESCLYKIIEDQCTPHTNYYDAFTLLNMVYFMSRMKINEINKQLKIYRSELDKFDRYERERATEIYTAYVRTHNRGYSANDIEREMRKQLRIPRYEDTDPSLIMTIIKYNTLLIEQRKFDGRDIISILRNLTSLGLDIDGCIRENPSMRYAIESRQTKNIYDTSATILFNIIQYFNNTNIVPAKLTTFYVNMNNVFNNINVDPNLLNLRTYITDTIVPACRANGEVQAAEEIQRIIESLENIITQAAAGRYIVPGRVTTVENSISTIIASLNIIPRTNIIFEAYNTKIRYEGGMNNTINIFGKRQDITGEDGIISIINNTNEVTDILYGARYTGRDRIMGGANTFYSRWAELQGIELDKLSIKDAEKLFLQFTNILGLCEGKYFLNRDLSDNFYTYNIEPVRYGGHTQIEMMAFIDSIIEEYYKSRGNESKLKLFLMTFIHFPYILNSIGLSGILTDIHAYINIWFKYENIDTGEPSNYKELSELMKTIIDRAGVTVKDVLSKMPSDYTECANYLDTIYPFGHFATEHSVLESIMTPTDESIKETINEKRSTPLKQTVRKNLLAAPIKGRPLNNTRKQNKNSGAKAIPNIIRSWLLPNNNRTRQNAASAAAAAAAGGKRKRVTRKKRPQKRKTRHAIRKNK